MPPRPDLPSQPLPEDKELVLKVVPMPADVNANGDIFGGWVMAQVDLAGSVLPQRTTLYSSAHACLSSTIPQCCSAIPPPFENSDS